MRTTERSKQFQRDYKRELKGRLGARLDADLMPVIAALEVDGRLERRHNDHALSGDMAGLRDCHVRPDLLRIYAKPDPDTLRLLRLGSHSEIFR